MITSMDWLEESEVRKHQAALKTAPETVFVTTYPTSLSEAFQRANAYMLGHAKTTTGAVSDTPQRRMGIFIAGSSVVLIIVSDD